MEQVRPVKGYENLYGVTNTGVVISFRKNSVMSNQLHRLGYEYVYLSKDGERKKKYIHRLVAEHFLDGQRDGVEVNHKDGNKTNNYVSNLEWVTRQQNMSHAKTMGFMKKPKGSAAARSKLSEMEVKYIREVLCPALSNVDIAEIFGLHQSTIARVKNGVTYAK